ncbi:hypothetical protein QQP08_016112 [Theobroma cacao]|nr:hypothetical protein QQP08_016112 [Theobroma cacao]
MVVVLLVIQSIHAQLLYLLVMMLYCSSSLLVFPEFEISKVVLILKLLLRYSRQLLTSRQVEVQTTATVEILGAISITPVSVSYCISIVFQSFGDKIMWSNVIVWTFWDWIKNLDLTYYALVVIRFVDQHCTGHIFITKPV